MSAHRWQNYFLLGQLQGEHGACCTVGSTAGGSASEVPLGPLVLKKSSFPFRQCDVSRGGAGTLVKEEVPLTYEGLPGIVFSLGAE